MLAAVEGSASSSSTTTRCPNQAAPPQAAAATHPPTLPVDDDVGEGRGGARRAQHVPRVHAVTRKLCRGDATTGVAVVAHDALQSQEPAWLRSAAS